MQPRQQPAALRVIAPFQGALARANAAAPGRPVGGQLHLLPIAGGAAGFGRAPAAVDIMAAGEAAGATAKKRPEKIPKGWPPQATPNPKAKPNAGEEPAATALTFQFPKGSDDLADILALADKKPAGNAADRAAAAFGDIDPGDVAEIAQAIFRNVGF